MEKLEKSMRKPGINGPNSSKNRSKINHKSLKKQAKTMTNPPNIVAENSRNEFGCMVGSGTVSRSPLVKFLNDFGRHLGPSWALDGCQIDVKIIKKSMPKSFKKFMPLVEAARRPRTSPRRPQDGPKPSEHTPRTQKSSQNGTKFAPK